MTTFTRSQKLLISAGAALGGAALVTLLAGNIVTLAGAGATAVDIAPPFVGPDFPVCHTPAATGLPNIMLRLAQTEVPRAEISAASSAPAFVETEPPLWTGLGSITYKITAANERAQALKVGTGKQALADTLSLIQVGASTDHTINDGRTCRPAA